MAVLGLQFHHFVGHGPVHRGPVSRQVGGQAGQIAVGSRGEGKFEAVLQLQLGETAFHERFLELSRATLTVGI